VKIIVTIEADSYRNHLPTIYIISGHLNISEPVGALLHFQWQRSTLWIPPFGHLLQTTAEIITVQLQISLTLLSSALTANRTIRRQTSRFADCLIPNFCQTFLRFNWSSNRPVREFTDGCLVCRSSRRGRERLDCWFGNPRPVKPFIPRSDPF